MARENFFKDKSIVVFGGTGSIGSEIVNMLLKYDPKVIRIFSNSENELWETKLRFKAYEQKIRYLLGDIRSLERVIRAVRDVDYVFNAAAIKHVPFSEYNPIEAVSVNIFGLEHIIEACFQQNVKKMVHISTDKAVNPTSVMGATKMLGERLCTARDVAKGSCQTIVSCVRFGNVLGSRGSIIPLIINQIKRDNFVTLTHEEMERFIMSTSDAANLVLKSMTMAQGGEIFVLKMPIVRIKDLIEVLIEIFAPKFDKKPEDIKIKIIGSRQGEKLTEELISPTEIDFSYEAEGMYLIFPENYDGAENIRKNKDFNALRKIDSTKPIDWEILDHEKIKQLLKNLNFY